SALVPRRGRRHRRDAPLRHRGQAAARSRGAIGSRLTPVQIGLIGVGALALRGILPHLTQDDVRDQVRVRALCDPVVGRARATAEEYGVARAYARVDELLEDDVVDAVTVASP